MPAVWRVWGAYLSFVGSSKWLVPLRVWVPPLSMVNRNLLAQFGDDEEELKAIFSGEDGMDLESWLPAESQVFESNKIVTGRVLEQRGGHAAGLLMHTG